MRILSSICVGLVLSGNSGVLAAEVASSGGTPVAPAGETPTLLSPAGKTETSAIPSALLGIEATTSGGQVVTQVVRLQTPVREPMSWQASSNSGLARPAAPGGLRIVAASASLESSAFAGTWKRENTSAGEIGFLILNTGGAVTAFYAAKPGHAEQSVKGRWNAIEQGVRLDFRSEADMTTASTLRGVTLSMKREGARMVLVGDGGVRFVRAEASGRQRVENP